MPFTPFHFGAGATIHALTPRHVSFLAFCASNVIIDVETAYFIVTNQHPLHRFLHTYVGASFAAMATVMIFGIARRVASRLSLPNHFDWQALGFWPVSVGAAAGAYSHVLLDSLMHSDVTPFAPFSSANPLLHAVPVETLHALCLAAGLVGGGILWLRHRLSSDAQS